VTITEHQKTARNGERFVGYTSKGRPLVCKWLDVRAGLFEIVESGGRAVKDCVCDLKGSPETRVERLSA
jgi:hypothetical protein